jgi:alkylation response protein AidB-like acyl-CoA dehydrogenase
VEGRAAVTAADLLYGEVEQDLRNAVRRLLRAQPALPTLLSATNDKPGDFSALRAALFADVGAAGVLVSEDLGGQGATTREAAVIAEEVGRAAAPVPYLTSAIVSTVTLAHTDDRELLPQMASGSVTAAIVASFADLELPETLPVRATRDGLVGSVRSVAGADTADLLIVPVQGAASVELHCVTPSRAMGVTVTPVPSLDMTRPVSDVVFSNAGSRAIGTAAARCAVDLGLLTGAGMLASEQLGVAGWCLDTTLDYVKQRRQFGRPIGSFQAVKHRLADLWVEIQHAAAAARYVADVLARDDADAAVAAAMAQSYCASVSVHAAEECIQLHGGSGMAWENPAHLYLKRAKADQLALGTPFQHRSRLAELVGLPPT